MNYETLCRENEIWLYIMRNGKKCYQIIDIKKLKMVKYIGNI